MNKSNNSEPSSSNGANAIVNCCLWTKASSVKWIRSDNAVVKYREEDNYMYAKPWLDGHKGWVAYSPTDEFPLSYKTKKGFKVNIKYKTAENAMAAIDRRFPVK